VVTGGGGVVVGVVVVAGGGGVVVVAGGGAVVVTGLAVVAVVAGATALWVVVFFFLGVAFFLGFACFCLCVVVVWAFTAACFGLVVCVLPELPHAASAIAARMDVATVRFIGPQGPPS
jgi:hypothetical protein